ncbi:unnamed protein product [Rotaria magnacalcarata]|uniref:Uncharacterized protein n=1 Tax=Rotaria magnacalcarata TaxID=392030 RepID=A0A814YEK7_9BILA|nr:unnamed protein product [Rotaria magnacalcarata]
MKRLVSSISNSQDTISSRLKRTRSSRPLQEEEAASDVENDSVVLGGKENSIPSRSHYVKEKSTKNNGKSSSKNSNNSQNTSLRSTISISSSPSTNLLSSMNQSLKSTTDINQQLQHQNKDLQSTDRSVVNSVASRTSASHMPVYNNNRLSSSIGPDRSTTARFSGQSLIEGSMEYRELKRLYLHEKKQADEWKKDYQVLKNQLNELKASTLPRPTAEALEWLQELFDLMNSNTSFRSDGRSLAKIGEDLGLDEPSLMIVAARTPQKSALKLFRLLYPTIGNRTDCKSISDRPSEVLQNIYLYVRTLHPNLSFKMIGMRRAIGTSIRAATHEIRKLECQHREKLMELQNDENMDPDERQERIQNTINNMEMTCNTSDFTLVDQDQDVDEDDEDNDETQNLIIEDNLDIDEEDEY